MVVEERVYIGSRSYIMCIYSAEVKDTPDERCPGVATPQEVCPGNQEELVAFLMKSIPNKSKDEILELLKKEAETPMNCDPKVNWSEVSSPSSELHGK